MTTRTKVIGESKGATSDELENITYVPTTLRIQVTPEPNAFTVTFDEVIGFRMLDERDLTDVWSDPDYDPDASVYKVMSGGWLELEKSRSAFLVDFVADDVQEFLVTSGSECVNVLVRTPPKFSHAEQ